MNLLPVHHIKTCFWRRLLRRKKKQKERTGKVFSYHATYVRDGLYDSERMFVCSDYYVAKCMATVLAPVIIVVF